MNILITGGAGYIGSHAAVLLAQIGHRVVIYDNLSNSDNSVLERIQKILGKTVDFVEGDIRDSHLLTNAFKKYEIESVIHFAGFKSVSEAVKNPLAYYNNNVTGTLVLLEVMRAVGVKTIVFSSSATVYGKPCYLPYDEKHPTNPVNPYGRSKLQVEEILRDLSQSDGAWRICALRYFNPVGAHESAKIGESPKGSPNNLMPYIVNVAAGAQPHLNVYGGDYLTKDGTGERDYIHVLDLVEGHVAALNFLLEHPGFHTFNLGVGRPVSVLELVEAFEKVTGVQIPILMAPRREGDLPAYYADIMLAEKLLHWKSNRSLGEMCLSAWNWRRSSQLS